VTTNGGVIIPIRSISDPAEENPNVMRPEDFEHLVGTIRRDGFVQPVLVRNLGGNRVEIIDGSHRKRAAQAAGLTDIPAIVLDVGPEQARALRISMNRLRGELDLTVVAREFQALAEAGWDVGQLAATGFSSDEVDALLRAGAGQDRDAEDELPNSFSEPDVRDESAPRWALELEFSSREELNRVKRRLKKLAGKGAPLEAGLLKALAED
jgi:hypothetical protein